MRLLILALLLSPLAASGQSLVDPSPGVYISADLLGQPYVIGSESPRVFSVGVGARLGSGLDAGVWAERGRDDNSMLSETTFEFPGATTLGVEASVTRPGSRGSVRIAGALSAEIADGLTARFRPEGVFYDDDRGVRAYRGAASVSYLRAITAPDAPVTFHVGGGPFAEFRAIQPRTMIFREGQPDARVEREPADVETPVGVLLEAPVSFRLGPARLSVEPQIRLDLATSLLGGGGFARVTARLSL